MRSAAGEQAEMYKMYEIHESPKVQDIYTDDREYDDTNARVS